jgi:AraC-like DNA-binding protein
MAYADQQYDYLRDPASTFKPTQLLILPADKTMGNCQSFGFDSSTHWIRHQFVANNSENRYLINHLAYYNQIRYYLYDASTKQWVKSNEAGTYASDKGIEWDYSGSVFEHQTQKNHTYILLAGYKVAIGSIVINFELLNQSQYKKYRTKNYVISFLLLGVAMAIFLSSLLFFFIKDLKIYLFYSVYVLGVVFLQIVNQGYLFYLIESDTETYMLIYALGSAIFVSSFILFFVELLKTRLHPLRSEKRLSFFLAILIMCTYFLGAFWYNAPHQRQVLIQVQHIWFLGVIGLTIFLLVKAEVKKLPMARYALFAILPALFAGFMLLLISSGWLHIWGFFKYNFNICLLIEAIILGFAIINFEKKQRSFAELLKQRVSNLSHIIQKDTSKEPKPLPTQLSKKSYSESSFSESDVQVYFSKIEHFMSEQKLYLERDLDISSMADKVGIKGYMLSEIINRACGKNFNEYVNIYRIAAAKKILESTQSMGITIEAVGELCGFSTKSTFYAAFKKFEQCTPAQYQKQKLGE